MKRTSFLPCETQPSQMIFEEDPNDEISCAESSKKRRLATDQVRALEQSFDVENRLEPERKAQLAQDLGLQPRQVAVWFQNRRARWKTKNLERDFSALKSRYDNLRQDFESLRRDNEALAAQLAALKAKRAAEKPRLGVGVEGGCESDSSGVMNRDVFKAEEDWEETFADEYGSTLAWFSAEISAGGDCSEW